MRDLHEQLQECLRGRVCLMGLGNPEYGDDGFGVRLAEELAAAGVADVVIAGASPERLLGPVCEQRFDAIVLLDAMEFGAAPGSVVVLGASEMSSRYPQVCTHKISLGLLAMWAEANGTTKVWLLGVQPESIKAGAKLSATVAASLDSLKELIVMRMERVINPAAVHRGPTTKHRRLTRDYSC